MKKFWILAVVAMAAIIIGGCGDGGGAEATAKKILEASKQGDVDTVFDHIDLQGVYDMMKEQMAGMGELPEFAEWEKQFREAAKKDAKPNEEFEYEILEVKEEGDKATVKVKTKEKKDAEWEERTVEMKKIDGKWKLTAESMQNLG